jgi:N-methylhydantoinase B
VLEDVLDDFCGREYAFEAYGVVINDDMTIDTAATDKRRGEMARVAAE